MANVTAPQFQQDVNNTADWANGDENTTVTMRLGQQADSPAKVIKRIGELAAAQSEVIYKNATPYTVGNFTDGFTYTALNQRGEFGGDQYVFLGGLDGLPHVVAPATDPTLSPELYAKANYNDAASIANSNGGSVQDFINEITKVHENSKTLSQLGISSNTTPTQNALIMQNALNSQGAIIHDLDFEVEFNQQLLVPDNCYIGSILGKRRDFRWSGADGIYAITRANDEGWYKFLVDNVRFSMVSGKLGLDLYRLRYSAFKKMEVIGGTNPVRFSSNWYLNFNSCTFSCLDKHSGSITADFSFVAGEAFNLVNSSGFINCQFERGDINLKIGMLGEAVTFKYCGVEGGGTNILIKGQGGCKSAKFETCYIEKATNGNIVFNKTEAGSMLGLEFNGCYYGTESTSTAGIIEFKGTNGGKHSISIKNSTIRTFGGVPSSGYLLSTSVSMSNIWLTWKNNGETTDGLIAPFSAASMDWRYIDTDVMYKCTYAVNPISTNQFGPASSRGELFIIKNGFYRARIVGTFQESSNVYAEDLSVIEQIPSSLAPAASLVKSIGYVQEGFTSDTESISVSISNRSLRARGMLGKAVSVDFEYPLNIGVKIINFTE